MIAGPAAIVTNPNEFASMLRLGVRLGKLALRPSTNPSPTTSLTVDTLDLTPKPLEVAPQYHARFTEFLKPTMAERVKAFDSPAFKAAFDAAYDHAEWTLAAKVQAEKTRCHQAGIPYKGLPGVVLLDVDETTLSNNRFYRDEIAKGADGLFGPQGRDRKKVTAFDQHQWDFAITGDIDKNPMGEVIPRAKAFIDFCEANGIQYAYASGRSRMDSNENDQLPATRDILKEGGMMGKHCQGVYLKPVVDMSSSTFKARVREQLEAKLNGPVILCIGDQPSTDFMADPHGNIQLPNAFYRWDVKNKPMCHVQHKARPLSTLTTYVSPAEDAQWSTVA